MKIYRDIESIPRWTEKTLGGKGWYVLYFLLCVFLRVGAR